MTKSLFRSAAMVAIAAALAAAPIAALAQTAPMQPMMMQMAPQPTTLSLDATGEVSATPDKAMINFSVVTQAGNASDAMKNNNIKMNNVMAALKAAGIADKDIQTSSLNLAPQYDYGNGNTTPRITGYQAQNQVTVRINDLNRTGPVVDAVIKAGVNQVDSISFGLKNDDALLDQARQQAVQTLMQRANLYAAATGMRVKRLLTLSEGGPTYPGPQPVMAMVARGNKDVSTPVAAGEMQLSVQVSATFELEK